VFFCHAEETIDHLFKLVWRVVHFTFNVQKPANETNMFGNWLNGIEPIVKAIIRAEVCA
jgi:hypothetical protein